MLQLLPTVLLQSLLMLQLLPTVLLQSLLMLLQLLLMLSMPQLLPRLPQLSMLPQLTMPQPLLTERLRFMLMRFPPTLTPMLFPMTTQRLTSKLRRPPMVPAMSRDLTLLLFPMAESNMLDIPPMDTTDMLPMSPMRELPNTQNMSQLLQLTRPPQPTMPKSFKPSICF